MTVTFGSSLYKGRPEWVCSSKMNALEDPLVTAPMGPFIVLNGLFVFYESIHGGESSPGSSPRSVATTDARAPSPASLPSLDLSDVGDDNDLDVGDDSSFQVASHAAMSELSSSVSSGSDDDDGADFT